MIMSASLQTPAEIDVQKLKEQNSLPSCVSVHYAGWGTNTRDDGGISVTPNDRLGS
jgi:hypothetical protein